MHQPVKAPAPRPLTRQCVTIAKRIIAAQQSVPPSPCRRTADGAGEFCAAAALALGLIEESRGPEQRDRFANHLLDSQKRELIFDTFRDLQVSETIAQKAFGYNDACEDDTRKVRVLDYLDQLAVSTS